MCGLINDTIDYVTSSVKELASHPFQTLGTALLGPALATGLDAAGIGFGSMISPVGNFSNGAWSDMFADNPGNSGLNFFHGVNDVADKVAPAIAGGYAAGGSALGELGGDLGGAASTEAGGTAAGLGADTFATGLGDAAGSLGSLESGLGGSALFGTAAGTGTAIGSGVAQGLGAGGLGIAGGDALGGVGSAAGQGFASALGGANSSLGTGLGSGAAVPQAANGTTPLGGGAVSGEGGQAAPGALQNGASAGQLGPDAFGGGVDPAAASQGYSSPAAFGGSNPGVAPQSAGILGQGGAENAMGATDIPGQSIGSDYGYAANSADQGGGFLHGLANLFGGNGQANLSDLLRLGNTGMNAFQQYRQQSAQNNYADSIKNLFSPTSPYAQQMQQTLARQDAAAGRNSQYGTRSVQLAAALAQAQANALGNSNYARAATATPGMNALNGLFANFSSPQGAQSLARLGSAGFNGLQSLFGGF